MIFVNKIKQASITVEAAYLLPIILGIIFVIMTVSFYFYDGVAAQAVLDKNIQKADKQFLHPCNEEMDFDYTAINDRFLSSFGSDFSVWEENCKTEIEEELSSVLILSAACKVEVNMTKTKITARLKLAYEKKIPFMGKTKTLQADNTVCNPSDFIRLIDLVEEGVEFFGGKS